MAATTYDAIIVGAGFSGIYQLYRLRQLGLSVKVVDMAGDVGGTWYWNRYPGAMSDTESFVYRYSWDEDDLQTYPWSHHYVKQPDVLAYLEHIVAKHDLRRDIQFKTELVSATWNKNNSRWQVELEHEGTIQQHNVKYLITALGVLSKPNYPDIPGIDTFSGTLCHTAAWPKDLDLHNKRVGIIGNGSTGVQVITAIAPQVKQLLSFQRHPQYSVPSGDRPVDPSYRAWVNENYPAIMTQVRNSITGFGFEESTTAFEDIPPSDREAILQRLWDAGNGFKFMFGGFSDIATNKTANEAAASFIRKQISNIVTDPEKARKLTPHDHYARRPLCDGGYYASFNHPHVDIVSLQETPITQILPQGIQTADGKTHDLDVIIFATGFDAIEGNYNRVRIRGRNGTTLRDHWAPQGPTSYLGVAVPNFPNMFMILGPQGPFTNMPPALEAHVDLVTDLIAHAESVSAGTGASKPAIEASPQAEATWLRKCDEAAEGSLFKETASWIFGQNVPGKKYALRFYFGGLKKFYEEMEAMKADGFRGFRFGAGDVTGEAASLATDSAGDQEEDEAVPQQHKWVDEERRGEGAVRSSL
ncbi:Baeyer-Villiger monooxygenase [Cyphellophora attinorum]|uniref:Baeyer-Villiger monooxygenase n=1 Tax=Cyphellophora attinorum TaxID=1664694 RepID=A0A0N0NJ65_9EURO|nr:Baeyer-Villiger monooxygenase [Phialophora attinorum]KPI36558.1 Baeyer-Villiger monooxygenase [Phialophora attinorum]